MILALGIPFLFVDVIAVWLAYSYHREGAVVVIGVAALLVNLASNAVLIPVLDYRGAAIATVISEAVNCAGYCVLFRRAIRAHAPQLLRGAAAYVAAGASGALAVLLIDAAGAGRFTAAVAGAGVAVGIACLAGLASFGRPSPHVGATA